MHDFIVKPCPFCGNTANTDEGKIRIDAVGLRCHVRCRDVYDLPIDPPVKEFYVSCLRCGGRGAAVRAEAQPITGETITEDAAAEAALRAWNRRAAFNGV